MIRYLCTLHYKIFRLFFLHIVSLNIIILELLACGWCRCEFVHPVPMFTVFRLILSLSSTGWFIDAFTIFLWVLFGLAALIWVLGLGSSAAHMCTVTTEQVITHTYSKMGSTFTRIFNHINRIIGKAWTGLLLLTPSVMHSSATLTHTPTHTHTPYQSIP
jgi:hypothetical protein